jgi:hypothetical protein
VPAKSTASTASSTATNTPNSQPVAQDLHGRIHKRWITTCASQIDGIDGIDGHSQTASRQINDDRTETNSSFAASRSSPIFGCCYCSGSDRHGGTTHHVEDNGAG